MDRRPPTRVLLIEDFLQAFYIEKTSLIQVFYRKKALLQVHP